MCRLLFLMLYGFVGCGLLAPAALRAQTAPPAPGAEACATGKQQLRRFLAPGAGKARSGASPHFDATYYHLSLDPDFDAPYLHGQVYLEGRVTGEPLQQLVLDLDSNMQVDSVRTEGRARLTFSQADDLLRIELPGEQAVGTLLALDVFYQGLPQQSGFGAFTFGALTGGDPYAWSLSEPYGAREWWPCKDHPSDKADSIRVTITVPEGMRVGSNGLLQHATASGGRLTYDWFSRYPIATYLVSIAAGTYNAFEQVYRRPDSLAAVFGVLEMPVLHYAYESRWSTLPSGWAQVIDMMPVFEYWFGPYPFSAEKYGHAEFTWGGGMEHQTMSSMGGTSIGLVAHELGHMWFGDLVTLQTWPHLWLNEGFATYAELLYWQARAQTYPGTYEQVLSLYMDRARHAPGTLVVEDTTSINSLFDGRRVYAKGGVVLHMLRRLAGDEAFRSILHAYTSDPSVRYGTATTADFQRIAEAAAGEDLDAFFRQWVTEGTGHPVYEVRWTAHEGASGFDVAVVVEQTQEAPASAVDVFEMPVTLVVQTAQGEHRFRVPNDRRQQTFNLPVPDYPTGVLFDPDGDLLRNEVVPVVADRPSQELPEQTALAALYPNPTSGALHVGFSLSQPGSVDLTLHDALGRRVRVLLSEHMPAGRHEAAFRVEGLASGLYYLRMTTAENTSVRSIILRPGP